MGTNWLSKEHFVGFLGLFLEFKNKRLVTFLKCRKISSFQLKTPNFLLYHHHRRRHPSEDRPS
jgi:hypothetical protein